MLIIENQRYFDEVVTFAKKVGLYDDAGNQNDRLASRLAYLTNYGGKGGDGEDRSRVRLYKDAAPYSFGFVLEQKDDEGKWTFLFEGGLIFHGAHDGNGNGSAPTFAVSLTPCVGWAIHT